jgi:hypothetical protein
MSKNTPLKASALKEAIKTAYRARRPLFIHGQPGAGKSDVVRKACEELKIELRDVRASQLESVDLRGLPYIEGGLTHWSFPNFLPPMLNADGTENLSSGLVFLDELNQANQGTQAASYQLILDRRLGDYVLPKNWSIVAAGNRAIDRAIANKMGSALKNRFIHVEIAVDHEEWITWALQSGIHPSIVGYMRYRPTGLNDLEGVGQEGKKRMDAALEGNAFATPRSWFFASEIIKSQPHPSVEYALLEGTIGQANIADYMAFLRVYRDLPDLDDVIKNPKKYEAPSDPKIRYAITSGLSSKATPKNFVNVMAFMEKMPAEFQVLLVKEVQQRDWSFTGEPSYTDWVEKNVELLG